MVISKINDAIDELVEIELKIVAIDVMCQRMISLNDNYNLRRTSEILDDASVWVNSATDYLQKALGELEEQAIRNNP